MNIKTTISLDSMRKFYRNDKKFTTVITRGATAELLFDLNKFSYLLDYKDPFKYIDQITFLLQQGRSIYYFNVFDEAKNLTPNCGFDQDDLYVSCLIPATDTRNFKLASEDNPMQFEIVLKVNTETVLEQKLDSTIIEKQLPILVTDSIYSKMGGN